MGHPDYEAALAVYRRIAERSEVVQIHPQWNAVLWVRAANGHLYQREDPGGGIRGECQISFQTLAMYLGCAEGYRTVPATTLPTLGQGDGDRAADEAGDA